MDLQRIWYGGWHIGQWRDAIVVHQFTKKCFPTYLSITFNIYSIIHDINDPKKQHMHCINQSMSNFNKLVQLWRDIYTAGKENNKNYTYNKMLCQDNHLHFVEKCKLRSASMFNESTGQLCLTWWCLQRIMNYGHLVNQNESSSWWLIWQAQTMILHACKDAAMMRLLLGNACIFNQLDQHQVSSHHFSAIRS